MRAFAFIETEFMEAEEVLDGSHGNFMVFPVRKTIFVFWVIPVFSWGHFVYRNGDILKIP